MGLNKSKGNMYSFITHTWNTVKGECYHDCSYCYMKRWGKLNPVRFDEKELKTDLGIGNFIFVGSSCDMWAKNIPEKWILDTLNKCENTDNNYLFQTKNPSRIRGNYLPNKSIVCTTIESDIFYKDIMRESPEPYQRALGMYCIDLDKYITIEPIMDFNLNGFIELLSSIKPKQINIGADSGNNNLPEPSKNKTLDLIEGLKEFTTVHLKKNINRILK